MVVGSSRSLICGVLILWTLDFESSRASALPSCDFPAIYNFGDSNSDTGGISAAFEPIPTPYGQTFFHRPSGRDSDGRLVIDFIAEELKLPYLSAYLNSLGTNYRHGANFATGGSTIRRQNETIFQNGISPFSLDIQVIHYNQFKSRSGELYKKAKESSERSRLPVPEEFSKALYTFDIGQNDLSVAFRTMNDGELKEAIPDIINQFATAVQKLYQQGARSFWIHNTGPIGCLPVNLMYPIDRRYLDQYGCIKSQNEMAMEFNKHLKERVGYLRGKLPDAALTYVDMYAAKYGLTSNAKNEGFENALDICCGHHEKDGNVWCGQKGRTSNGSEIYGGLTGDPWKFISWDGVHYSEAANHWFVNRILNGSMSDPPLPITQACHRA